MSKSSRCTRIILAPLGSPPRYRREKSDLVAPPDRGLGADILLVDRHANYREISQRLGMERTAVAQPLEQPGDVIHLGGLLKNLLGMPDAGTQPGKIQELHLVTRDRRRAGGVAGEVPAVQPRALIRTPRKREEIRLQRRGAGLSQSRR